MSDRPIEGAPRRGGVSWHSIRPRVGRSRRKPLIAAASAVALMAAAGTLAVPRHAANASTALTLTATVNRHNARITGNNQGFSVESADFAHGYLTKDLLSQRLKTLGPKGVIRLGGYSMDLVWPAFGARRDTPAPEWAIGGTVDQADFDALKKLLDDTGWKVTLGAPLKSVIEGGVSMDQVVSEVVAARATLGNDLLAVELGNEYDHVTDLSAAGYYAKLKEYQAAINAGAPGLHVKMTGPSANTSSSNTKLDDFVTAALADTSTSPASVMRDVASHWYPTSHCGSRSTSIPVLMSADTYTKTRAKLQGIVSIGKRLHPGLPMVINESNTTSCSGQDGVSNSYATSLWGLDYLMQTAQSGVSQLYFHTSTAAVCGRLEARDSDNYPISYRFYAAFCAKDKAAMDANRLSAAPLYYGIWAFRQVPHGQFVDLNLADADLSKVRAYGVLSRKKTLTMVLINIQDPSSAEGSAEKIVLNLPRHFRKASAVTLKNSGPGGLGSTDPAGITLGGRSVSDEGVPSGAPAGTAVPVRGKTAAVTVAPGTAQIITFSK